jgi:hypothetical protein
VFFPHWARLTAARCISWVTAGGPLCGAASFRTRLDNNGQKSILARDGYDVIDPYRPSTLPYIVALARDDCDAGKKQSINQG